ncbi:MAG: vitamin B12-dependent ribonucleotide reductase, partial [Candidatus Hydrogenedentota bacterium]
MTSGTLTNTNEKGHNVSKQKRRRTAKGAADTSLSRINNKGLKWFRRHTQADTDVWSLCEWERRTAEISDDNGRIVFRQENVEVPKHWSNLALNIVASKYFQGKPGTSERETSVRQMIYRVAHTIACWGREDGYFASEEDAKIFEDELTYLLLFQHASFNSPVWFNVGHEERPQCSACFINSVEDSMESILNLAKTEGMLFKYGSGTGSNLSTLRSSRESLRGGGVASGPVSFMKGFDAFAGVIKSGGKTRRAAKMVILNVEHPDIMEFIECKYREEKKAHALIDAGYDGSVNGEAYSSVFFQNANHSVRVSDTFMKAVLEDGPWHTKAVTTGTIMETYRARDIMRKIAECTHACGDPGLQFHDTINTWHTCKASGPIVASNPCSEYMFLNDTACNLASINLLHYLQDDHFDTEGFSFACETMITAQEIIVDRASYPKPEIADNSHKYRPLGLGYANLGALLMTLGIPYDSEEARSIAAYITALMTGRAYLQSAHLARIQGCFEEFPKNRDSMLEVMRKHQKAVEDVPLPETPTLWKKALFSDLRSAAEEAWKEAVALGEKYGYRNSQATVLAPTGTIAFMMDCDTTGIEPDIALVKYKRLSGGGTLKIVNRSVGEALRKLGYSSEEIKKISAYIDANDTIEGAPGLREEDLPVFDCAFRPLKGTRSIEPMGHVRMMAAVQPFLSGAISKTVNMPHDATVEEIEKTYIEAWKLG